MTQRQKEELELIPMGQMFEVKAQLRKAGAGRAALLLDEYEERLAIIVEGRDITEADISAAWESTLRIKFDSRETG